MTEREDETLVHEEGSPKKNVVQFEEHVQNGGNFGPDGKHPPLFMEMAELRGDEWRETARWVKFEEVVEERGNRWSKPFVATLSLHSIFELRCQLMGGLIVLDTQETSYRSIIEETLDKLVNAKKLTPRKRELACEVLQRKHTHQFEHISRGLQSSLNSHSTFLRSVRSIRIPGKKVAQAPPDHADETTVTTSKKNLEFLKKLPKDTEACNIFVGEADFLRHQIAVFIRLKEATNLGQCTEIPIPSKFMFILLGPTGQGPILKQVGRSMATLMTDPVFHSLSYEATNREDLLEGVDEFLSQVTVLPPGSWNPDTRIEPPAELPSLKQRKAAPVLIDDGQDEDDDDPDPADQYAVVPGYDSDEENEGHGNDPALQRTGRLFGGLINDIKRKAPFYVSDFTDALSVKCIASSMFMYFALLTPIITFGGLLEDNTGQKMATMENMLACGLCGITYHMFCGQPLTVIGSTGPLFVFETIVFELCADNGLDFLSMRFWINTWICIILLIMVATDASVMVKYVTRFSEEGFATLVAIIFIFNAVKNTFQILDDSPTITFDFENATTKGLYCHCAGGNYTYTVRNYPTLLKIGEEHNIHFASRPWFKNKSREDWNAHGHKIWIEEAEVNFTMMTLPECNYFHGKYEGDGCYHLFDIFLISLLLMLGTYTIATGLKALRTTRFMPTRVRATLSDFAVVIAVGLMAGVDYWFGLNTPKLSVPDTVRPTDPHRESFLVPPFNDNPWWTVLAGIPPALVAVILIFIDQQITVVIVNRKENKLRKGAGYHLDLFVVAILMFITGLLGLPSCVAATVLSLNHLNSLKIESDSRVPGEKPTFIGVKEQRLTGMIPFLMIGLSTLITDVLKYLSMPVLYGVFLYMGLSALNGIQMVDRLKLMFMPMKYQPDYKYLRNVPIRKVHLFTLIQVACLITLWIMKNIKQTKMLFPIILLMMILVRKFMERFFTLEDIHQLDDPMPDLPCCGGKKREQKMKEISHRQDVQAEEGVRQRNRRKLTTTEDHLEVPTQSGGVMKIPLTTIAKPPSQSELAPLYPKLSNARPLTPTNEESLPSIADTHEGANGSSR